MTNADIFQQVFGIYATELWAKPEKEFLEWLNASTEPERKNGKWIQDGHHIQCNQCGISICDKDREGDVLPKKFCPNCGSYNGGDENRENSHTV